jgi:hypothetical protein
MAVVIHYYSDIDNCPTANSRATLDHRASRDDDTLFHQCIRGHARMRMHEGRQLPPELRVLIHKASAGVSPANRHEEPPHLEQAFKVGCNSHRHAGHRTCGGRVLVGKSQNRATGKSPTVESFAGMSARSKYHQARAHPISPFDNAQ